MKIDDIVRLSEAFVDAIKETKTDFPVKDRMSRFPRGCCDDVSDLFANFLFEKYGECSTRVDGAFYADDPENNDWHTWLEIDGYVVDLSAYQYKEYSGIYVGNYDEFHKRYEIEKQRYRGFRDLGEGCWERMQYLYDCIISRMEL